MKVVKDSNNGILSDGRQNRSKRRVFFSKFFMCLVKAIEYVRLAPYWKSRVLMI